MLSFGQTCCRSILRSSAVAKNSLSIPLCQFSSSPVTHSEKKDGIQEGITVTKDGSTIVCWHPEKPFPYEFSKPLPESKAKEVSTVLRIQSKNEIMDLFRDKPQHFVTQDLMKITFTCKHKWVHRPRDKRAKKTPREREYL